MPRKEWESLKPFLGRPVKIDVTASPIADVSKDASVLAAVAVRSSSQFATIDIYRYDEEDYPYTVNKDSYTVLDNIIERSDYQQIIMKSSTSDSSELREFLMNNVGLLKNDSSEDHWLTELPSSVKCVIKQSST